MNMKIEQNFWTILNILKTLISSKILGQFCFYQVILLPKQWFFFERKMRLENLSFHREHQIKTPRISLDLGSFRKNNLYFIGLYWLYKRAKQKKYSAGTVSIFFFKNWVLCKLDHRTRRLIAITNILEIFIFLFYVLHILFYDKVIISIK